MYCCTPYPSFFGYFASRLKLGTSLSSLEYPVILFGVDVEGLVTIVNDILWLGSYPLNTGDCCVTWHHLQMQQQ